ncbi:SDR family oxidoreductase [Coraliomargarita parva]|uniref:SDR family oxidoreductase n=1 Tax=Coraliomargarita parva TaxID=3014050 RepID=UPI0022B424CE|nr:SDR family oxidoreductase [Coraliomargarita parva]
MKILFIGGTGNISAASVRRLIGQGHQVVLLNRGTRPPESYGIEGATTIQADIHDETATANSLNGQHYDVVVNCIAFNASDVERDVRLFAGRCAQYIFISSASAYQKPLQQFPITESTPLENPYWDYSRQKIAAEAACMQAYHDSGFPVTIVRPSHTYETVIPVAIGGWNNFAIIERMRAGRPVLVHGDGTSLWTITHSEDFAIGFTGLFGHPQAIGEAFHITSDEVQSWNQIYDAVGRAAGVEQVNKVHVPSEYIARMVPGMRGGLLGDKAASAVFDNSKIKEFVPAYNASIPFQEGICRTIEWIEAASGRKQVFEDANVMMDAVIETYLSAYNRLQPLHFK